MSRRTRGGVGGRVGALLVVVGIGLTGPVVGQVTSERLDELITALNGRGVDVPEAMDALTELGSAAVPALCRGLADLKKDEKPSRGQVRAVRTLGRIGADAVTAVPDLLALVSHQDENLQAAVLFALSRIAPYARAHCEAIRETVIQLLADKMAGADAVQRLMLRSQIPSELVQAHARTFLDPAASTDKLAAGLSDPNPFVREHAAELLLERHQADEVVVVALRRAIDEPHPKVVSCAGVDFDVDLDRRLRHLSARVLVEVAPDDPRTLPAHCIMLELALPEQRRLSVMALGRAGEAAAVAVPVLIDLLERDFADIRREVITTLGMIGPKASAAIPALEELRAGKNKQFAERARAALEQIRR